MSWTSDDESALAFHDSIFDPRRSAIISKRNGFSLTSLVDDSSLSHLNHSNGLLFHSPIRSARPGARREEAPTKFTQHHPFLGSPSQLNPCHDFLLFPTPSLLLLPHLPLFLLLLLPCPIDCHIAPPSKVLHYSRTCSGRPVFSVPSPWTRKISTCTHKAWICRRTSRRIPILPF